MMERSDVFKAMTCCGCTPDCKWCPYYDPENKHKLKCFVRRNRDFNDIIKSLDAQIADLTEAVKKLKLAEKKCETCLYAKPYTGESKTFKGYVECTNKEHLKIYCKHWSARYRLKTTKACKCYKERTGDNE